MRALITGGAGFIGSHLSEALLDSGHDVLVLDDLSTGSIDNIARLKGRSGFEYFIDSVENEPLLAELIDRSDVVFHFAAAVGVKLIVEQPVRTIETNVHGTEVVLKHANKKKKLVVIASTSEVYGKIEAVPFREDSDLVMGPTPKHRWAYACSKAIDEFLALAYFKERKLPIIIVRFFNTVGPRQTGQYGMVIPTFVKQALGGRPITVYGSGQQSRCFCYLAGWWQERTWSFLETSTSSSNQRGAIRYRISSTIVFRPNTRLMPFAYFRGGSGKSRSGARRTSRSRTPNENIPCCCGSMIQRTHWRTVRSELTGSSSSVALRLRQSMSRPSGTTS